MTATEFENEAIKRGARRREKSRDAARNRRQQESDTFAEICGVIPVPENYLSQMDRTSVMRLVISFMKSRKVMDCASFDKSDADIIGDGVGDEEYVNALNGFLMVLSNDYDVLYVSANVKQFIGMGSLDLIGKNLFGYTHEGDHGEITQCLKVKQSQDEEIHSFFMRMKSTLTSSGKSVNLKSATYKVLKCEGIVKHATDESDSFIVTYCEPIPHPSTIEMVLDSKTFSSQHSLDMKFTLCDDPKLVDLLGYSNTDMAGKSFYEFCHTVDLKPLESSIKKLLRLGQITTDRYRMLAKDGGYVWVVSQATIINNPRNHQPSYIVCVHYIISEVVDGNLIFSLEQLEANKTTKDPVTVKHEVIEDLLNEECMLQDSSEEIFCDSTNAIFYDVDVNPTENATEETLVKDSFPLITHTPLDAMALNAPSIGDQIDFTKLNFPEIFKIAPIEEYCSNNMAEEQESWNCQSPIQEEKLKDLFTGVNIDSTQDTKDDCLFYSSSEMFQNPPLTRRNQNPPLSVQEASSPSYHYMNSQCTISKPNLDIYGQKYPPSVPPKQGLPMSRYQVISVPKSQYNQQLQHPAMKRQFGALQIQADNNNHPGCQDLVAKRKKCLQQFDSTSTLIGRQFPGSCGDSITSAATNVPLSKKPKFNQLSRGHKANTDRLDSCRESNNRCLTSYQERERSMLPVLSLHDCEVNAPVSNNDYMYTMNWNGLSSSFCI